MLLMAHVRATTQSNDNILKFFLFQNLINDNFSTKRPALPLQAHLLLFMEHHNQIIGIFVHGLVQCHHIGMLAGVCLLLHYFL